MTERPVELTVPNFTVPEIRDEALASSGMLKCSIENFRRTCMFMAENAL